MSGDTLIFSGSLASISLTDRSNNPLYFLMSYILGPGKDFEDNIQSFNPRSKKFFIFSYV